MAPEKKVFYKKLFALVLPIAFQNFMLSLVSASDAFMLGRLNQNAMSAVSLAGQVMFVFHLFLGSMTIGASIFVAQYYGKKDMRAVERFTGLVMGPTFIVSLLMTALSAFCPRLLMKIWTSDPELIELGAGYLRVVSLNYLLTGVTEIFLCVLKNTDRAKKSSLISSGAVVINIVLNAILIFGLLGFPAMGIAGAALATVISRAISFLLVLPDFFHAKRVPTEGDAAVVSEIPLAKTISFHLSDVLHVDPLDRKDFWKPVTPIVANMFVWGLGFSMGTVIMGRLGQDAIAANSIASVAKSLTFCFCQGIGAGAGIMVGHELGAGKLDTAKLYGHMLCISSIVGAVITDIVLISLTPVLLKVADLTPAAQAYLPWMLVVNALNILGGSLNSTTISGIFTAGGDSKFGLKCDIITLWFIIVPAGLLSAFVLKWPVLVVYLIVNLDEIVKLPAVWVNYHKYNWVKDLTRDASEPST
ncbi:MAG: MATE family efflux transporter [Firmicutes bacterium]|nr:MATE family efflux transporter [Bacillota bacterium]